MNSCLIICTNTQNFVEEGEPSAFSISMAYLGILFLILGATLTLFGLKLEFQGLSVMLVIDLINFGVRNQAPQVSFKFTVVDSMLVSSYEFEFAEIKFCESLDILEAISNYGAQEFALHVPRPPPPSYSITCSSPHCASKHGDLLDSLGHLLLILGADITSHG